MSRSTWLNLRRRVRHLFARPTVRSSVNADNAAARERAAQDAVRRDIHAHSTYQKSAYAIPAATAPRMETDVERITREQRLAQERKHMQQSRDRNAYQSATARHQMWRDEIRRDSPARARPGLAARAGGAISGAVWMLTLLAALIILGAVLIMSEGARTMVGYESVGQKIDRTIARFNGMFADAGESVRDREVTANDRSVAVLDAGAAKVDAATGAVREGVDAVSKTVSDAAITASIKADLLKDPYLSALRVEVDTLQGEVTLSGDARTEASRERAGRMAAAVAGVKKVDNRIVINEDTTAMARVPR